MSNSLDSIRDLEKAVAGGYFSVPDKIDAAFDEFSSREFARRFADRRSIPPGPRVTLRLAEDRLPDPFSATRDSEDFLRNEDAADDDGE